MNNNKSFFVISNGSSETYPNNTLTNFTNRLPAPIDIPEDEKYEVAVESVGFSCLFRNIKLPENDFFPSFMISDCLKSYQLNRFGLCPDGVQNVNPICSRPLDLTKDFKVLEHGGTHYGTDDAPCFWHFGKFAEKFYTQEELTAYFDKINNQYETAIKFINGKLEFGRPELGKWYWVLVHPTMMETFGFEASMYLKFKYTEKIESIYGAAHAYMEEEDGTKYLFWRKKVIEKLVNYQGEIYFAFQIGLITDWLRATKTITSQSTLPTVVKVVSDKIEPQIFNSSFSNDMVVFCPDFKKRDNYYFHEFESKQYIPILNSTITDFDIKLCDEDNKQLQLLPGVPTILKLNFRKMEAKRTFNVRLTSVKSKEFRKNTNCNFKVKLPNVLSLDKSWRVALTSISHPNIFKTFLTNKNSRGLFVRQTAGNATLKQAAKVLPDEVYTIDKFVEEIKEFFEKNNFGEVTLSSDNKLSIKFYKTGTFIVSNNILRVLGYNEKINLKGYTTEITIDSSNSNLQIIQPENSPTVVYILSFGSPINLEVLRPNYIIAYTNFIESSIIGGIYSKILRVIPITNTDKGFVITEFKHKEYLELQNTEISELEVVLRAHDGEYVNFGTQEDIILNLEFTNSPD